MATVKKFLCRRNSDGEECQGLIFPSRKTYVGIDCWRMLNRIDTCSYPVARYESFEKALEFNTQVSNRKTYYYINKEENVWSTT